MRVLAIDLGYDRCGVAVLEKEKNGNTLIYSDCIQTSPKLPFPTRLKEVGDEIEHLIRTYQPDETAIERIYFNTNQKTAIAVAGVRGMILFIVEKYSIPVSEYTPGEIKSAVTSFGRASKEQIITMIPRLISVQKQIQYDDEYDAIAVGITHLAQNIGLYSQRNT